MPGRKHYLDNLRSFTTLLLFPFHTFMIYNDWGEPFYVHGENLWLPSRFIDIGWLFMMPLLFAIAGMSARYALERRSEREFMKERVNKLVIPAIVCMLLIIPVQSYIAGIFHNGVADYTGYFTRLTDFTGYDGAFTPGQLWFALFLIVYSFACLPFMLLYKKKGKGTLGERTPLFAVCLLGLLPCLGNVIFDISGKSPTEFLAHFLLGYFFLANEALQKRLERYRYLLLGVAAACAVLTFLLENMFYEAVSWLTVLAILGLARRGLDFSGAITRYLAKSAFGVYLFHQSWIVIAAFFILKLAASPLLQIALILAASVALTFATYEIAKRVKPLRLMFGLKG